MDRPATSSLVLSAAPIPRFVPVAYFAVVVACAVSGASNGPALGQGRPAQNWAFSSQVPNDVQIYLEVDHIARIEMLFGNDALRVLLGRLTDQPGKDGWRELLAANLGVDPDTVFHLLLRTRFALVADGWDRVADGVLLFRRHAGQQDDPLRVLVGNGKPRSATNEGRVRVIETQAGVWLADTHIAVAVSRTRGPGTLFDRIVDLANKQRAGRLSTSTRFRTLTAGLPGARHAMLYWTTPQPSTTTAPAPSGSELWPSLDSGALGVYIRRNQIEFLVRGDELLGQEYQFEPRVDLGRFFDLPQSTLAAWATSLDVVEAYDAARHHPPHPALARFWRLLDAYVNAEQFRDRVLANVGRRCILMVGCDFTSARRSPYAGLMIESTDARAVVESLRDFALEIAEGVNATNRPDPPVHVTQSEYLGTTIYRLSLPAANDTEPSSLAGLLADDINPSFATVRGWVVASTSIRHLRQIIDAANGIEPRLAEVIELGDTSGLLRRAVGAALVQPAFALDTLSVWNDSLTRARQERARQMFNLGIRSDPDSPAGQVVVSDIQSNGPADGVLHVGDTVIGIGDALLNLNSAAEDLRDRISDTPPSEPVRLRVVRGGEMFAVAVDRMADDLPDAESSELNSVVDLIEPVQDLAGGLSIAMYSISKPPRGAGHAQLVLKFDESATPITAPPERKAPTPTP